MGAEINSMLETDVGRMVGAIILGIIVLVFVVVMVGGLGLILIGSFLCRRFLPPNKRDQLKPPR